MSAAEMTLGATVTKMAFRMWTGDTSLADDGLDELTDLIAQEVSDPRDRQKVASRLENIAEIVGDRVAATLRDEFRDVQQNEQDAAILAVNETLTRADTVGRGLLTTGLDAATLARIARRVGVTVTQDLSAAGTALYDVLLPECCAAVVEIADKLPRFQADGVTALLSGDRRILERIEEVLTRLPVPPLPLSPAASAGSPAVLAAARRIARIRDSLGEGALRLAYHAAVPVVVDAELLNLLRVNFFLDPPHALPYEVEAELLLSPLFREVGEDLFEIEPGLRNVLLSGLQGLYGSERVRRVAELLELYTDAAGTWRELELAQRLTVLSFLDPARAQQWLDANEAGAPSASDASAPPREWYVAMRRRIGDQSADVDVTGELISAMDVLRHGGLRQRLEVIENLAALARLPRTPLPYVIGNLTRLITIRASVAGSLYRLPPDVQAALTLIGTLPHHGFNLADVTLTGADLAGLNFADANFAHVTFKDVDAAGLDLRRSNFGHCAIVDTVLDGARLDGANLDLTELAGGSYAGASFREANLVAEVIRDVDLSLADLTESRITSTQVVNLRLPSGSEPTAPARAVPTEAAAAEPAHEPPASGPDTAAEASTEGSDAVAQVLRRAQILEEQGDWDQARDLYRAAVGLTQAAEPVPLAGIGRMSAHLGEWDQAVSAYEAALALYQRGGTSDSDLDDHREAASTLMSLGDLAVTMNDASKAIARFEEAKFLFMGDGDALRTGRAEAGMGRAYATAGMPDAAERHYRDALGNLRRVGARRDEAEVAANLADVLIALGRLGEAADYAVSSAEIFRDLSDPGDATSVLRRTAEVLAAAGVPEAAVRLYQRAVAASAESQGPDTVILQHALAVELTKLADQLSSQGRPQDALSRYRDALDNDPGLAATIFRRLSAGAGELMSGIARADPSRAGNILLMLDQQHAARIVDEMDGPAAAAVVSVMNPAEAARLLELASGRTAAAILTQMPARVSAPVVASLPPDTAARFLTLPAPEWAQQIITILRDSAGVRDSSAARRLVALLDQLQLTAEAATRLRDSAGVRGSSAADRLVALLDQLRLTAVAATRFRPGEPDSTRQLVQLQHEIAASAEAIRRSRDSADAGPLDAARRSADLLAQLRRLENAIVAVRESVKPSDSSDVPWLADVLFRLGRTDEGITALRASAKAGDPAAARRLAEYEG